MTTLRISVVGAPGTGRSRLCADLNVSLGASGLNAMVAVAHGAVPTHPDITFLMGLNSACGATAQADQSIRATLVQAGLAYEVLYGSPDERLAQAHNTIQKRLLIHTFPEALPEESSSRAKRWIWDCEKCSDPYCEHRLLTDLLKKRLTAQTTEA